MIAQPINHQYEQKNQHKLACAVTPYLKFGPE